MWTTSFGQSIRRNQHCINLRSCLGSAASFVLNQLKNITLEIFIWSGRMESFLLLLAREGHWNIRWKVIVLPSLNAKLRQTNATSFPYPTSSYLGTSLPGRPLDEKKNTTRQKAFALSNSLNLAMISCCSETVRDIDPSASGMMMQMVLSKDNRYAAAFTR